ncbi:MAG: PfkB family carbohydrate kinase [Rhodobacteraceae bacterium]|nr:PfkB family carbohydrate kinase [Paracoccaceae bacterium]
MAIWNLGSINADLIYDVPHLPGRGETIAATQVLRCLGGKGANMSVAAARAAAHVHHIGAVGADGRWAAERLLEYGVDTRHIAEVADPTGHAIIAVDAGGENLIVLFAGANHAISDDRIGLALTQAHAGDILVLQNETNGQVLAAETGARMGLRVCYAAAPFDAGAVRAVLPYLDLLVLNAVEASQLETATGMAPGALPVAHVIVTLGAQGSLWIETATGHEHRCPAVPVTPVDTTGAGDTFTGYVLAGLDRGMPMAQAIALASQAAALMVTRRGTADVIPDLREVQDMRLG